MNQGAQSPRRPADARRPRSKADREHQLWPLIDDLLVAIRVLRASDKAEARRVGDRLQAAVDAGNVPLNAVGITIDVGEAHLWPARMLARASKEAHVRVLAGYVGGRTKKEMAERILALVKSKRPEGELLLEVEQHEKLPRSTGGLVRLLTQLRIEPDPTNPQTDPSARPQRDE